MRRNKLAKQYLSIKNIGPFRFWLGVTVGLLISITLSFLFNYSREFYRLISANSADLVILGKKEVLFYNYFYAITSICLGLAISISIWMANHQHNRKKARLFKQLSRNNNLLIFWFTFMAIGRIGSNMPFILYSLEGYDNHLDLFQNYKILFLLIPVVIFLQAWFNVLLVYKAGKWIFISVIICIMFPLAFVFVDFNHEKVNAIYKQLYTQDYAIIDHELKNTELRYGITYESSTEETLKKWHSVYAMEQVSQIKKAFSSKTKVAMDTILLQKIIIQLAKKSAKGMNHRKPMENWYYIEPNQVVKQLEFYDPESPETYELFQILKEQIDLTNLERIKWNDSESYSRLERRRANYGEYYVPTGIIMQLKTVSDSLKNTVKYKALSSDLPKLTKEENKYLN